MLYAPWRKRPRRKSTKVRCLTEKRWEIVRAAQGKGELSVRELARAVRRDVKRVHEDVVILAELGLLERTASGGVLCPYSSMHIDMYLKAA